MLQCFFIHVVTEYCPYAVPGPTLTHSPRYFTGTANAAVYTNIFCEEICKR